jgi:hypothetical protein
VIDAHRVGLPGSDEERFKVDMVIESLIEAYELPLDRCAPYIYGLD